MRARCDERHRTAAGEQPLDLLEGDLAAPDDQAAPPRETQAGDVEGHGEHVPDAGLVADAETVLADAFLAGVGLGGHLHSLGRARGRPSPPAAPGTPATTLTSLR